jgi:hypothetical protein
VDAEDGPLQFGRYPLRVLVAGPCPVVEALSLLARKGTNLGEWCPLLLGAFLSPQAPLRPCAESSWGDEALGSGLSFGPYVRDTKKVSDGRQGNAEDS